MCNSAHCQDLHVIKIVENGQQKHNEINNPNSYNWNIDNDNKFFIPTDYLHHDIGYKFFWKMNDTFNYFSSVWNNGQIENFKWNKMFSHTHPHQMNFLSKNENTKSFVLWIDRKDHDQIQIEQQFNDGQFHFDFCETISKAEHHLLTHMTKIKSSSSSFQIICRGYYKDENKNPLNLLTFLHNHQLNQIPVSVFTQDIAGLEMHLQNQATSMGIHDWKQRLFVTNNTQELIKHVKQNSVNKH